jgi:hypothetical protein
MGPSRYAQLLPLPTAVIYYDLGSSEDYSCLRIGRRGSDTEEYQGDVLFHSVARVSLSHVESTSESASRTQTLGPSQA